MRKIISLSIISLAVFAIIFIALKTPKYSFARKIFNIDNYQNGSKEISRLLFNPGESMEFQVRLYGVKAGKTILRFLGEIDFENKKAYLIESESDTLNFKGKEKIYTEKINFYPLLVERDILFGWNKELIKEEYTSNKYQVKITNQSSGKTTVRIINKDSPLQNSISMLYFLRQLKDFLPGETIKINLPTKEYNLIIGKKEKVKVPLGEFLAYAISDKKGAFKIWISADNNRIPLRFEYNNLMQKYSTEITSFDNGPNGN